MHHNSLRFATQPVLTYASTRDRSLQSLFYHIVDANKMVYATQDKPLKCQLQE